MADQQTPAGETGDPPRKRGRQPSYLELLEERQQYKETLAQHVAETEDRTTGFLAALTALSDEQRAFLAAMRDVSDADRARQRELIGALEGLVDVVRASAGASAAGSPSAGDGPAKTMAAAEDGDCAAGPQNAAVRETTNPDDATGDEGTSAGTQARAVAGEEAGAAAGRSAGGGEPEETAGEDGSVAGTREPGDGEASEDANASEDGKGSTGETRPRVADDGEPEATAATNGGGEPSGSSAPAAGEPAAGTVEPGDASGGEDAASRDAGEDAATAAARFPSAAEIAIAIAEKLSLGEIEAHLETIRAGIADREEAEVDDKTHRELQNVVNVLAALRSDLGAHSELIQALHRPAPPGKAPDALPAAVAEKQHGEVMGQVDKLIVSLADMLRGGRTEETAQADARSAASPRPPPTGLDDVRTAAADLSKQLRVEGRGFRRFAWIAAAAAATTIPMALALGIFVQHEYTLMPAPPPPPAPNQEWKDLIWNGYGRAIADCLLLEDAGAGECVITVTPPAQ